MGTRAHFYTDNECGGAYGRDTLAMSTDEVNCSDCVHKMYEDGVFIDEHPNETGWTGR